MKIKINVLSFIVSILLIIYLILIFKYKKSKNFKTNNIHDLNVNKSKFNSRNLMNFSDFVYQCIKPNLNQNFYLRSIHGIEQINFNLTDEYLTQPRLVYDVFMFNNEFALLEIRLIELWNVVDKFVIIESDVSLVGNPKPLYFNQSKNRYAKFLSKIEHVIKKAHENMGESNQRALALPILNKLNSDTMIIMSDLDEIPRCWTIHTLKYMKNLPQNTFVLLEMNFYYYSLRWKLKFDTWEDKLHSSVTAKVFLRSFLDYVNFHDIAFYHHKGGMQHWVMSNSGWHCSYCMRPEKIQNKIKSYSHQENNRPPFNTLPHIIERSTKGQDLFDRSDINFELVVSESDLYAAFKTNNHRFNMFLPEIENMSTILPQDSDFLVDEF